MKNEKLNSILAQDAVVSVESAKHVVAFTREQRKTFEENVGTMGTNLGWAPASTEKEQILFWNRNMEFELEKDKKKNRRRRTKTRKRPKNSKARTQIKGKQERRRRRAEKGANAARSRTSC